jgi:hypothetical protein
MLFPSLFRFRTRGSDWNSAGRLRRRKASGLPRPCVPRLEVVEVRVGRGALRTRSRGDPDKKMIVSDPAGTNIASVIESVFPVDVDLRKIG